MDIELKLVEKSKEAFLVAIELYNKPTIKYRVEGFSFFICNAWELMLKAHIMKVFGNKEVFYKDSPGRTISLENCIKKIFTNQRSPLRINLEKIIELRNTSTHFVTEEYEMIYIPLFQACVINFINKMYDFHKVDMTAEIPQNFLTLSVSMKALDENIIRAKYPEEISSKLITSNNTINSMVADGTNEFAIKIEHLHYITKDKSEATSFVHIEKDATTPARIIKELKDPNNTHNFTMKSAIKEINSRLSRKHIPFKMNAYIFDLFNKVYGIKKNEKYCYQHTQFSNIQYTYSMQAVELITSEICKDPENIVANLKMSVKKTTPGA